MRSSAASVHDCLRPGRTEGLNSLKNQPAWSGASREVTRGAGAPSFAAASQPGLDADHVTQPARRHRQGSDRHCEPRPHPDHAAPSFSCPCSARGRAASRQHLLGLEGWSGDVLLDALTEGPTGRWGQVARARVLTRDRARWALVELAVCDDSPCVHRAARPQLERQPWGCLHSLRHVRAQCDHVGLLAAIASRTFARRRARQDVVVLARKRWARGSLGHRGADDCPQLQGN